MSAPGPSVSCLSPDTVTFRETAEPTNSPELAHYFRNSVQLIITSITNYFSETQTWINEEFCSTATLGLPSMDRRRSNELGGLGRNSMAMLTGHCVMDRYAERIPSRSWKMRLLSTFVVSGHLLRDADIGYLTPQPLST